ncbi:hypothetical protein BOTBODRAFT_337955 [Botryobasidium botryosum FD-172 SS1]|uniref:Uncharacterized protein n=1 Tax=Botryobasidium botryosum (strain FD-172 SS1) TaxID=930990 RepID=A0A067MST5_BOTB1|nr:hypothetical protein BOTBODRAFT_337955 [Botryobasidium botryosum FD-172 SS1]
MESTCLVRPDSLKQDSNTHGNNPNDCKRGLCFGRRVARRSTRTCVARSSCGGRRGGGWSRWRRCRSCRSGRREGCRDESGGGGCRARVGYASQIASRSACSVGRAYRTLS